MTQEELDNLLRRADRAADEPRQVGHDLAHRVRRRHARGRRIRAVVGTTGIAAALLVGGLIALRSPDASRDIAMTESALPPRPGEAVDVVADRLEVARLQRDADVREAAVRLVMDGRAAAAAARRAAPPLRPPPVVHDPLMELQWQREQAALVLVRQGDRLGRELDLPGPAAVAYRQASETFAGTRWAAVAESRLQTQ